MQTRDVEFFSGGTRLAGMIQSPSDFKPDDRRGVVVVCSGLHGLKEWVPARWWPQIVDAGYHCFAFDYRGFGTSDGPRGRMIPREEIDDVRAALSFLQQQPEIDPDRIALIGWGLGGGIVVATAAEDPRVKAVVCANGAGDYGRTVRDAVAYPQWLQWQEMLGADRVQRSLTGKSTMVDYRWITHPLEDNSAYQDQNQFSKDLAAIGRKPSEQFTLETCEAYCAFRPEDVVGKIAPRPLLIVHGGKNEFMPVDEALRLRERAGPVADLRIIPNALHLEMIEFESPFRKSVVGGVVEWLQAKLPATS
jgi:pimeloyl-ACP methyl ester carboxylesterase